jgi:hypothetical protein
VLGIDERDIAAIFTVHTAGNSCPLLLSAFFRPAFVAGYAAAFFFLPSRLTRYLALTTSFTSVPIGSGQIEQEKKPGES